MPGIAFAIRMSFFADSHRAKLGQSAYHTESERRLTLTEPRFEGGGASRTNSEQFSQMEDDPGIPLQNQWFAMSEPPRSIAAL
jgi:hypothetical protein